MASLLKLPNNSGKLGKFRVFPQKGPNLCFPFQFFCSMTEHPKLRCSAIEQKRSTRVDWVIQTRWTSLKFFSCGNCLAICQDRNDGISVRVSLESWLTEKIALVVINHKVRWSGRENRWKIITSQECEKRKLYTRPVSWNQVPKSPFLDLTILDKETNFLTGTSSPSITETVDIASSG